MHNIYRSTTDIDILTHKHTHTIIYTEIVCYMHSFHK
uniref:Uncharacterized protein n=1 Tax=Anguilla anguilla TaxID=7936 RepID=A0A0E9RTZ3_ANGAN